MSDENVDNHFEELLAEFAVRQEEMKQKRMQLISLVCKVLRENKIASVIVSYDGSGDEGNTNEPVAFGQEVDVTTFRQTPVDGDLTDLLNELAIPDELRVFEESVGYFSQYVRSVGEGLCTLLSDFVPDGYENNEGGTGCVVLNAVTGLVEVEHGAYVTEVYWHTRKVNAQGDIEIIRDKKEIES